MKSKYKHTRVHSKWIEICLSFFRFYMWFYVGDERLRKHVGDFGRKWSDMHAFVSQRVLIFY